MKHLSLILSIVALVGVVVLFVRTGSDGRPQRSDAAESPAAHEESEHEEEVEIAIVMGRIQRFHQKFWLALRANNPELTQFYLHEMEEAMAEIADGNVVDDGIDISANMRAYGLKVNEHLQQKLKTEGIAGLAKESTSLVDACNACHKASGYDLIKIQIPDGTQAFPDQVMLP